MHFINYHPLKDKLRTQKLSDREALPYLAVFSGLTAFVAAFPMLDNFNEWDVVSGVLSVIFAVGGIVYSYKCNGGREGFDLIQKYVVLGWIVSIRCLLFFIPLILVISTIGDFLNLIAEETKVFDVLLIATFEIVLYQRIGRHIRDTRKKQSEQDVAPDA